MNMKEKILVTISEELLNEIDSLADKFKVNRSFLVEHLLRKQLGLPHFEFKETKAVEKEDSE